MNVQPPLPTSILTRTDFARMLAATTNYEEKLPRDGQKRAFDLSRMDALLASVGNPHRAPGVETVHIAGSKGKGTVARLIAHGLRGAAASGRVGLFTSPHLVDLSERITIDGHPLPDERLAAAANALLPHLREVQGSELEPTFFEILTSVAWVAFREAQCARVVLETGLGGRLDSTNVCLPDVTVITSIELEHTRILGDTIEKIAAEKAGILKPGVPAVTTATGAALEVIRARAAELGLAPGVDLHVVGEDVRIRSVTTRPGPVLDVVAETDESTFSLSAPLAGVHHAENLVAAWTALSILGTALDSGTVFADARLPGLLEPVAEHPLVLVDGAHTPRSARATRAALAACWPGRRVVLLTAMLEEKSHAEVVRALTQDVEYVVATQVGSPRSVPAADLAATIRRATGIQAEAVTPLRAALGRARERATPDGLVLATGSVYLAGDVKSACLRD